MKQSVHFKSKKWSKKAFCYMLDQTRVNSQTIWAKNHGIHPRDSISADYMWNLGMQLIKDLVIRRRFSDGYKFLHKNVKVQAGYRFYT